MDGLDWLLNRNVLSFLGRGLATTFFVTAICAVLALVLGVIFALARMSSYRLVRWPAVLWIELMRSVPLLLIVFVVFFGINASLELNLNPITAGVIALTIFNSAIVAEIVRAGMQSVDRGIIQAAEAQALSPLQILFKIQMPIVLRIMTPALITQLISLLKSTSLLVVIGVEEFLSLAMVVTSNPPYDPLPVYVLVALTYFTINYALSCSAAYIEHSIGGKW